MPYSDREKRLAFWKANYHKKKKNDPEYMKKRLEYGRSPEVRARRKELRQNMTPEKREIFLRKKRESSRRCNATAYKWRIKKNYGLTHERYKELLIQQDFRCAICNVAFGEGKRPHVDHCHRTGIVRGILCRLCNSMIGYAKDNSKVIKNAYEYLLIYQDGDEC